MDKIITGINKTTLSNKPAKSVQNQKKQFASPANLTRKHRKKKSKSMEVANFFKVSAYGLKNFKKKTKH